MKTLYKVSVVRFAPWIAGGLLVAALAIWIVYRPVRHAAPASIVEAAEWIGRCQEVARQTAASTSELSDQALNSEFGQLRAPLAIQLAQARSAVKRLRGELPQATGRWFPAEVCAKLLDRTDQLAVHGLALKGGTPNVPVGPLRKETAELLSLSSSLRGELQISLERAFSARPRLLGLLPGDWLAILLSACALLLVIVWNAATYREVVDYVAREKVQLQVLAEDHPEQAILRCHELSRVFLGVAQDVLQQARNAA